MSETSTRAAAVGVALIVFAAIGMIAVLFVAARTTGVCT